MIANICQICNRQMNGNGRSGFNLLNNRCIHDIAIGISAVTAFPLAPFLHLAYIGIDWFAVRRLPLEQLGIHPVATGAVPQAS